MLRFLAMFLAGAVGLATVAVLQPAGAYVLGTTSPGKWGNPTPGTGATITWSIMNGGLDCSGEGSGACTTVALSSIMPTGYMTTIQSAFAAWSAVANLTFVQVSDDGAAFNATSSGGDIRIGAHPMDGSGGTLAHGFYPPLNGVSAAGDIHFDSAEVWKIGFTGAGFDIFQVLTHELGHALGLDHTSVPNSLMNPFYSQAFTGPQADDIAGMRYLYGAAVVTTPEPMSLAVLGAGVLGLTVMRRRRAA